MFYASSLGRSGGAFLLVIVWIQKKFDRREEVEDVFSLEVLAAR